jgi:radical SAM superfamily enzyme YgiQ (UPF0313 family)
VCSCMWCVLMGKRVLLVQPPILYWRWFNVAPTLPHLLSVASFVKQHGFDVKMVDMQLASRPSADAVPVYFKNLSDFVHISERVLTSYKYDVLGVSCWTSLHYVPSLLLGLVSRAINPDTVSVVGGYHPSALPADFVKAIKDIQVKILESEQGVIDIPHKLVGFLEEAQKSSQYIFDYAVKGEGEKALLKVCREDGDTLKKAKQRTIVLQGEPIDNLDTIECDYSLLNEEYDAAPGSRKQELYSKTFPMHLSRGCPYDCEFCIEKSKGPSHWRAVTPSKAAKMVREVINEFNPGRIQFMDPCFGANDEWRRRFIALLGQEENHGTVYWCETAVNCTSVEDLKEFSRLPFEVDFGVESASAQMLLLMRKTRDPVWFINHHRKLVENCVRLSIPSTSFFVWGFPGETKETLRETLSYQNDMLKVAERHPHIDPAGQDFRLAPGSDVYNKMDQYSERFGTVFRCPDWWTYVSMNLDVLATSVDPSGDLTLEEKGKILNSELVPNLNRITAQRLRDYMYVSAKSKVPV